MDPNVYLGDDDRRTVAGLLRREADEATLQGWKRYLRHLADRIDPPREDGQ